MAVNFRNAVRVSKLIAIDAINEIRRLDFGGALLSALFFRKCSVCGKSSVSERIHPCISNQSLQCSSNRTVQTISTTSKISEIEYSYQHVCPRGASDTSDCTVCPGNAVALAAVGPFQAGAAAQSSQARCEHSSGLLRWQ